MQISNIVEFKLSKDLVEYDSAIEFMNTHINKMKKNNAKELLWFLEHNSIFTAGTSAKEIDQNIKDKNLIRYVGRGGEWTWHGPGQLVVYPIFKWDLEEEANVKKIISKLEQWSIGALDLLGIRANTDSRMQGVWVGSSKIGCVGLAFMRWVSRHGFTINYTTPKGRVETLDGCGLSAGTTTSLDRLGYEISGDELVQALLDTMPAIIGRNDAKS